MPRMNVHDLFLKNTSLCKTGYATLSTSPGMILKCRAVLLPVTHGQLMRNCMITALAEITKAGMLDTGTTIVYIDAVTLLVKKKKQQKWDIICLYIVW